MHQFKAVLRGAATIQELPLMARVRQMPNSLLQTWFDFIIHISVEKCPQCSVFTLVSAEHTRKSGMNRTSVKILRHHSGMINRMPALVKAFFIYVYASL